MVPAAVGSRLLQPHSTEDVVVAEVRREDTSFFAVVSEDGSNHSSNSIDDTVLANGSGTSRALEPIPGQSVAQRGSPVTSQQFRCSAGQHTPCSPVLSTQLTLKNGYVIALQSNRDPSGGIKLCLLVKDPSEQLEAALDTPEPSSQESGYSAELGALEPLDTSLWSVPLSEETFTGKYMMNTWGIACVILWNNSILQLLQFEYHSDKRKLYLRRQRNAALRPAKPNTSQTPSGAQRPAERNRAGKRRQSDCAPAANTGGTDTVLEHENRKSASWIGLFAVGIANTPFCVVVVAEAPAPVIVPGQQKVGLRRKLRSNQCTVGDLEATVKHWKRHLQLWDVEFGQRHQLLRIETDESEQHGTFSTYSPVLAKQYPAWVSYEADTAKLSIGWGEEVPSTGVHCWLVSLHATLPSTLRMADMLRLLRDHDSGALPSGPAVSLQAGQARLPAQSKANRVAAGKLDTQRVHQSSEAPSVEALCQQEEALLAAIQIGSWELWVKALQNFPTYRDATGSGALADSPQGIVLRSATHAATEPPDHSGSAFSLREHLLHLNARLREQYIENAMAVASSHGILQEQRACLRVQYKDLRAAFPEASSMPALSDLIPFIPLGCHCTNMPVGEQIGLLLHHLRHKQSADSNAKHPGATGRLVNSLYAYPRPSSSDTRNVLRQLPLRDVCCILTDVSERLERVHAGLEGAASAALDGALDLSVCLIDLHWRELVLGETGALFRFANAVCRLKAGLDHAERLCGLLDQWLQAA